MICILHKQNSSVFDLHQTSLQHLQNNRGAFRLVFGLNYNLTYYHTACAQHLISPSSSAHLRRGGVRSWAPRATRLALAVDSSCARATQPRVHSATPHRLVARQTPRQHNADGLNGRENTRRKTRRRGRTALSSTSLLREGNASFCLCLRVRFVKINVEVDIVRRGTRC